MGLLFLGVLRSAFVGLSLTSLVVVGGCSTTATGTTQLASTSGSSAKSASAKLTSIQTKRIGQGVAIGAMVGGLGAGVLTLISGGNAKQVAQNAVVGAAVGAAGGAIFAAGVNKSADAQAREQERYKEVIANTDTNIAAYKNAARTANTVATEERKRIADLTKQLEAGEITIATYKSQLSEANANVRALDRLINDADADIRDMTVLIGDSDDSALKARKASLQKQKATLERRRQLLLDVYDRVPPSVGLSV